MEPKYIETCRSCRWWVKDSGSSSKCKAGPPTRCQTTGWGEWPGTRESDWCGAWTSKN